MSKGSVKKKVDTIDLPAYTSYNAVYAINSK